MVSPARQFTFQRQEPDVPPVPLQSERQKGKCVPFRLTSRSQPFRFALTNAAHPHPPRPARSWKRPPASCPAWRSDQRKTVRPVAVVAARLNRGRSIQPSHVLDFSLVASLHRLALGVRTLRAGVSRTRPQPPVARVKPKGTNDDKSKQSVQVPSGVKNASHLNAVIQRTAEDDVIPNRNTAKPRFQIGSLAATHRVFGQSLTSMPDLSNDPISGIQIPRGQIIPDIRQIAFGDACANDTCHHPSLLSFIAKRRCP